MTPGLLPRGAVESLAAHRNRSFDEQRRGRAAAAEEARPEPTSRTILTSEHQTRRAEERRLVSCPMIASHSCSAGDSLLRERTDAAECIHWWSLIDTRDAIPLRPAGRIVGRLRFQRGERRRVRWHEAFGMRRVRMPDGKAERQTA